MDDGWLVEANACCEDVGACEFGAVFGADGADEVGRVGALFEFDEAADEFALRDAFCACCLLREFVDLGCIGEVVGDALRERLRFESGGIVGCWQCRGGNGKCDGCVGDWDVERFLGGGELREDGEALRSVMLVLRARGLAWLLHFGLFCVHFV